MIVWVAFLLVVYGLREVPALLKLPASRPKKCRDTTHSTVSTKVSIVIPCLNESWEHVSQTFLGLLHNTPHRLVKEIILISDGGETYEEDLHNILDGKIELRIVEHARREGLIRAKNEGYRIARGDIIVFYEPHVIASPGWLEPLVSHIEQYPNAVVMPALDLWMTNGELFTSSPGYYRFEWNFNLLFTNAFNIKGHQADPYPTPATSGGIFGIRKELFKELKLYDEKLEEWGGDHIELAFKAWLCGGRIDMIPCSRVFHWFRNEDERPYDVDVSKVVRNYVRLAEIWMDGDSLEAFYKMKPEGLSMSTGDIQEALEFRKTCKSMDWYLTNIDWELGWEKSRICIPNAYGSSGGCEFPAALHRATIDRTIPPQTFEEFRKQAKGFYIEQAEEEDTAGSLWGANLPWYLAVAALVAVAYFLGKNSQSDSRKSKQKKRN